VTLDAFIERLVQERDSKALPPDFAAHRDESIADTLT
jgi:hypothetical protein